MEIARAKECKVIHKALLIRINKLYREDMTIEELYEATRGFWKLGKRSHKADYAFTVYQGVIRDVFQIHSWHSAGTTPYETRKDFLVDLDGRVEFLGSQAPEKIRKQYIGKSVRNYFKKGHQSPVVYVNI